ncbi:hypothetical protein JAAARDRAFT_140378 [Jaapia argillacea MUCL 33604]|uniref:FAD/NAD(P)-binding domain-containing protein n=1 Tax=Jaapia argillacea MUCL 33604 TaxID=933084 RepID=A0A067PC40_9AGAM|nr:hypothetical protein JAAARDRAFT_140378 [Jaapia argillacea MUCL 33604]
MAAAATPIGNALSELDPQESVSRIGVSILAGLSASQTNSILPTLDRLGVKSLPSDLDALQIASSWFVAFSRYAQAGDVGGVSSLLVEDAFWRDILALTWDFRTLQGAPKIKQFLTDRLASSNLASFKLNEPTVQLQVPYPDLAWIQGLFTFETTVGLASGVFRLVPTPTHNGLVWKAHTILTNLEDLKGFPELTGPLRDHEPNHGKWVDKRKKELEYADRNPKVLIIGGGQSGLDVAARLKHLGIDTLVVEKQPRIGNQWRYRYEALCLHDPVWYDHMPYIPFPASWPVYTPAQKLADWLESYAHSMELNVWTSSTVTAARQDATTKKWTVTVERKGVNGEGEQRTFTVNHLVFAVGIGGGNPYKPVYPGMDEFEGQILHSSEHKSARDHIGKKVVVIGACTSGHDISADYVEHGVDVTMYQRSSTYIMSTKHGMPLLLALYSENAPPTDIADRVNASFPNSLLKYVHQRITKDIALADQETLAGLTKRGFRLSFGDEGSGFLLLAWKRAGGYYLDVGASQLIIDGKIKLKNDSPIERFTKKGLKFENGSELEADVVLFASGYGDPRDSVRRVLGDELGSKVKQLWGLNAEGEINGVWRDLGVENLWFMMGNLALCRFHSKHLALQIKAIEEGVFGTRYSLAE